MLKTFSIIGLLMYFLILLIVVIKEKKNETSEDYFFAGRTLPFWALSITFIASWWGAASALSTADLAFDDGLGAFWYYGVPVLLSTLLMIIFSKAIRKVGYLTQGKMMEARYNNLTSKMIAFMILVSMIFNAASQMVGIGDFFGTYLDMNYEFAVLIGTSIVLIYSMFGGFRGVVLTDIIQFVLLLLSAIVIFLIAMDKSGGLSNIAAVSKEIRNEDFMSISAGASKYFPYVITFGFSWMIQANVWQRISAAKDDRDAKKMTIMSFFIYIPLYLMVVLVGMASITIFDTMPEGGVVTSIVKNHMHPLLGAIVFIGISAAAMSTMDSLINTGAMTLSIDLYKNDDEKKKLAFSKISTLTITAIALLIALKIRSILEVAWIASDIITTGIFVPLIMGFVWRRGNSKGAISSIIFGSLYSVYNLLVTIGIDLPTFWEPQSVTQVVIGVFISVGVYVSVSLFTEPEYEKADTFIAKAGFFSK